MNENEQDEVIVDDVEENNEETTEEVVEEAPKEKPKRTPQEEYEYHTGKAKRLAKKLGLNEDKPVVKPDSSKPSELTDGQIAILRTEGIKSKVELALFTEVMAETGKGVLDLLDSSYFQSRLTEFRSNQESINAIPKGKNRPGQTASIDIDIAVAKYKEDGTLPSDFKTRSAVVKAIEAEENNTSGFDGMSVGGPR